MAVSTYTVNELSHLILAYFDQVRNGQPAEFPVKRGALIIADASHMHDRETVEQALDRYFEYVVEPDGNYIITGVLTKLI